MKIELKLQEKQKKAFLLSLKTPVLFYGGARGGGKSYLVRAREVYRRLKHPNTKGLIVRKSYPELLSNHIRMFLTEYPIAADKRNYEPKKHIGWFAAGEKAIYWSNGSITEFSYLGGTNDVYTYQGREYEDISIDEITQHEELVFKMLRGSNRTTHKTINPTMLLTGNPGGVGHGWVKRMFVDGAYKDNEDSEDFAFVQAKVFDNKALMDADPEYLQRLRDLPDDLRRAWLEGDWDVFAGQVFSEFRRELHVMKHKVPSATYPHFLWIDWGYAGRKSDQGAFAGIAAVLVQAKFEDQPFNRVVVYREWYGKFKHPKEWAEEIYKTAPVKQFSDGYADASMFNTQTDGSKPIAKLMEEAWEELNEGHWLTLKRGTRNRIGRVATLHNWFSIAPDGLPYMLITEGCQHLIRTVPLLVYNDVGAGTRIEDVDTDTEDHLYDALTYGLSGVKFIPARLGGISLKQKKEGKYMPPVLHELNLDEFKKSGVKVKDWRV